MKEENNKRLARALPLVPIIALAFAFRDGNSYSYYTFLRFLVCGFLGYWTLALAGKGGGGWCWILGMTALVYNPILPVELDRSYWVGLNALAIIQSIAVGVFLYEWKSFLFDLRRAGKSVVREVRKDAGLAITLAIVLLFGAAYSALAIWKITPPGRQWTAERVKNRENKAIDGFRRRAAELTWTEFSYDGDPSEARLSLALVEFLAENLSTEELEDINGRFRKDLGIGLTNWESELLPQARELGYRGY